MKKLVQWMMALVLLLTALGNFQTVQAADKIKVGILQGAENSAFTENREGFIEGLKEHGFVEGDNLVINYLNANGDNSSLQSMAEKLSRDSDFLFAVGTASVQALANVTKDIPIFFSSVTDPVGAGVVESIEKPGGNVTGTSNLGPIEKQVELMRSVEPEAKKVGIIYNAGESNAQFQVDKATPLLEKAGFEVVLQTIANTNEVQSALEQLLPKVDTLFLVTDTAIHTSIQLVGQMAIDHKVPVFGGSNNMIQDNGLATFGISYKQLGMQTADMLVKVQKGEAKPADIPVEYGKDNILEVNKEFAKKIGIDPESIKEPQ